MNREFIDALYALAEEKGISADALFEAVESALLAGYTKNKKAIGFDGANAVVMLNRETGEAKVYEERMK